MEQTLDITALSNDGRGIARVPGEKIVFVAGALPGERVRARITAEKKSFREAETLDVTQTSSRHASPPCPHADTCGGCPLMRMDYAEQLVWKRQFLVDALTRTAGLPDPAVAPIRPSPLILGYRNRVELAFGVGEDGRIHAGMRRRASHGVVRVPDCPVMPELCRNALRVLEHLLANCPLSVCVWSDASGDGRSRRSARAEGCLRFVQLRLGRVPDADALANARCVPEREAVWVVLLTSPCSPRERAEVRRLSADLLLTCPDVHCVVHEERRTADLLTRGEKRVFAMGRPESDEAEPALMVMPQHGAGFLVDAADFFQVNTGAADVLAATAAECASPGALADLYCGCGAPGLSLARGPILGVEYARTAAAMARRNARRFGIIGSWHAGDAAHVLKSAPFQNSTADTVLCDPPRAGVDTVVIDWLSRCIARRLIYISCNPVTLARDVKHLSASWHMVRAVPVDLFPHTPHVESVCLMSR